MMTESAITFRDFLLVHTCLGRDDDNGTAVSPSSPSSETLADIQVNGADSASALTLVRNKVPDSEVKFNLVFKSFQLHPEWTKEGEDKYEWYKTKMYHNDTEQMEKYTKLMTEYGKKEGIEFKFHGKVANTLDAHRVIQHFQKAPQGSPEVAGKIIDSLYEQYFTMERHPSAPETLLQATAAAGIPEDKARLVIENENEGLKAVTDQIRIQKMDGIDSVPYMVLEGKKRDFTLVGAKALEEYIASLDQVVQESK